MTAFAQEVIVSSDVHDKIVTLLGEIYAADTPQSLFSTLEAGCTTLGFDAFMLSSHRPSKAELVMAPIFTTHNKEFRADYERLNWIDDDMIIARTIGSSRAFVCDSAWDRYSDVRSQDFLEFLQANRMTTGIMVLLAHKLGHASFVALDSYRPRTLDPAFCNAGAVVRHPAARFIAVRGGPRKVLFR